GVLAFDTDSQWVVPPRPIESPAQVAAIAQRIRGIEIGSSTDLFRALWATRARLTDIEAAIKHVVLLTDGRSTYGDMEALVRSMRRRNITVSSIAIGKEADADLLQRLATAGYGRYYFTDDPRTIPRVLTQETELAGDFAIVEREFQPRLLAPSPIFGGTIQWQEFPRLNGFVRTRAKPTAEVVLSSDSNDPVLAQWQFGRGRVVAWTSDLGGAWSAQWSRWPGFDAFVRQAALWVMASPDDPATTGLYVTTAVAGTQATITIDSLDGRGAYRNGLVTLVELRGPDGVTGAALADQTGPGQYRAELTGLPPGVYEVRVEQRDGAAVTAATTGLVVPFEEELRRNGANLALLRYVAARTGGDVLQQPSDVLRVAARLSAGPGAGSALWLTLGVLAFVADVGVRRVRGTPREVRAQLIDQVESLRARGRALRQLRVRWRRR
ncbi:MAG: VWA domain-containing protein, partial [Actinobacteria bacterium]|nr:VWA domain-containing protein [Actinomycetota bacterium]